MAPKTTGDQVANTTRNTSESREHAGEPCLHATGRRFRLSAGLMERLTLEVPAQDHTIFFLRHYMYTCTGER